MRYMRVCSKTDKTGPTCSWQFQIQPDHEANGAYCNASMYLHQAVSKVSTLNVDGKENITDGRDFVMGFSMRGTLQNPS